MKGGQKLGHDASGFSTENFLFNSARSGVEHAMSLRQTHTIQDSPVTITDQ